MQYAINNLGERIEPYPQGTANCPCCIDKVVAKCGSIMVWHWAHTNSSLSCNSESVTLWHRSWKSIFPVEQQEIVVEKNGRKKIADIMNRKGVIEFQHSSISPDEITLRESHYDNMVWLFDCLEPYANRRITIDFTWRTFFWFRTRPSYFSCSRPFALQLTDDLIVMPYDCGSKSSCTYGSVIILTKQDFLWKYSDLPYRTLFKSFPKSFAGIHH